jgi:hypothetical protein
MNPRNDIPQGGELHAAQPAQNLYAEKPYCDSKIAEPTLRERLESRRSSLAKQLSEVDLALQVVYTNPQAEEIFRILKVARY